MAKRWSEVAASPEYRALSSEDRELARNEYFDTVVAPQLAPSDVSLARSEFDATTRVAEDDGAPSGFGGLLSNVWTGTKQTGRMVGAAGNTATGDLADVEGYAASSKASALANTPQEQRKLQAELGAIDRNQGAGGQIVDVLSAAGRNPMGTAQMVVEQAPNSAVALGTGWAGAKAGALALSPLGPWGAAAGGVGGFIGGMFLGNTILETGGKAIEKAEGGFTETERGEALREGAVKGGVITAVDTATLGVGGKIASTLGRAANKAGARAEAKVLIDAGVDMTSPATINAALAADKALFATAKKAGEEAAKSAISTGRKATIAGTGLAMETVGEGAGEYLGEQAATGKGDVVDATIEALSSFSQSAVETAYNYNKGIGNNLGTKGLLDAARLDPIRRDVDSIASMPSVQDEIAGDINAGRALDADSLLDDIEAAQAPQYGATIETAPPHALVETIPPRAIVETPNPRGIVETAVQENPNGLLTRNADAGVVDSRSPVQVGDVGAGNGDAQPVADGGRGLGEPAGTPVGRVGEDQLPGNADGATAAVTQEAGKIAGLSQEAATPAVVLQNRDRSQPESIAQMRGIAANPDPSRLSFSRDAANGAPVVFGDIPQSAVLGKQDHMVSASGRKMPVQYAVVDAQDLIASNDVNGSPVADYVNGVAGKLRAVGGNGRVAGLQEAHRTNAAGNYTAGIIEDAGLHGVADMGGIKNPVLVRVMRNKDVTPNIGDEFNVRSNMGLSAVEQARTDAARVKLETLDFTDSGEITQDAIKAFVLSMPESERNELMDGGRVGSKAVDRMMAAIFLQAYGDAELVRIFAQAQDIESKAVITALAGAAPAMARLVDAGNLDIRSIVADAAKVAVNASREGVSLSKLAKQGDFELGYEVMAVVQFMADNIRKPRVIAEHLTDAANFAYGMANQSTADMFGGAVVSRDDVIRRVVNDFQGRQENLADAGGRQSDAGDAGNQATDEAGRGDNQAAEGFGLETQTEASLSEDDARKARIESERQRIQDQADAKAKAEAERETVRQRSEAAAADFQLGQSAEDNLAGQGDIYGSNRDEATKEPWQMTQQEFADSVGTDPKDGTTRERHVDAIKKAHAEGKTISDEVLKSYPMLRSKFAPAQDSMPSIAGKPLPGRYTQPTTSASRDGQIALANRGGRIASLKMLNDQVREINPSAAYSDYEIENAANENLDALQDWLSDKAKPTPTPLTKEADKESQPAQVEPRKATAEEKIASEKAAHVLDLQRKQTGWKRIDGPNNESVTLVSYDGKQAVKFRTADTRSGTASVRMNAEAQAYAIDNPYTGTPLPEGELVSAPMYQDKDSAQSKQSAITAIKQSDLSTGEKLSTIAAVNKGDIAPEDVREVVGVKEEAKPDNQEDVHGYGITKSQAENLAERAFNVWRKDWGGEGFKTWREMLASEDGANDLGEVVHNEYEIYQRFNNLASENDAEGYEFTANDVFKALKNGELSDGLAVRKSTPDIAIEPTNADKMGNLGEPSLYPEISAEEQQALFVRATQRQTKANHDEVAAARYEVFMRFNTGALDAVPAKEVLAKLKTWSNYPKAATNLHALLNGAKPVESQWFGILNMSYLSQQQVAPGDVDAFVKSVTAPDKSWNTPDGERLRHYIARTLLGIDTRIEYKDLKFIVESTLKPLGQYSNWDRSITIRADSPNTVAHEIGHYLDYKWMREAYPKGSGSASEAGLTKGVITQHSSELREQWMARFAAFAQELTDGSEIGSAYLQDRKEVFARFVDRFVSWTAKRAGVREYDEQHYRDKFTDSQFRKFVRLLQEKAYVDIADGNPNGQSDARTNEVTAETDTGTAMFSRKVGVNNAITKLKNAAVAARAKFRNADERAKARKIGADAYFALSEETSAAEDAFAAELENLPDDGFALQAQTGDGRNVFLTQSANRPGYWQLTRYASDGQPWGHTDYPTKKQAIRDFLSDTDIATVESYDTAFSRKQPAFYSQLSRAIESAPDKVFTTATQFKLWLNSNAAKLGIKKDEVEWSGINDFLDMQGKGKGRVSKADVVGFLSENGVWVGDVVMGTAYRVQLTSGDETFGTLEEAQKRLDEDREWIDDESVFVDDNEDEGYIDVVDYDGNDVVYITKNEDDEWSVESVYGATTDSFGRTEFNSFDDALEYANDKAEKVRDDWRSQIDREPAEVESEGVAKFIKYTLPGGIPGTYREILVTLPTEAPARAALLAEKADIGRRLQAGGGLARRIADQNPEYFKDMARYEEINARLVANYREPFTSSHFGQKNILVHLRTDEVTGADGKRYLRVVEIQSDWGQAGKKKGFDTGDKTPFGWGDTGQAKQGSIPSAPFVTDTRAWVSLGIKRAIQQAVSSGVDGIVFATGQQNADLYDLSKQVDEITYLSDDKGTYTIRAFKGGQSVLDESGATLSRIEDLVGKEIATKISANGGVPVGSNSDFVEATKPQSVRELGEDVLGREMASLMTLDHVDGGMLAMLKHDQVHRAVVKAIPVDVVNMLHSANVSPDDLLRKNDVVAARLPIDSRRRAADGILSALRLTHAAIGTELRGVLSGGPNKELIPALRASDFNAREVAGIVSPGTVFHGGTSFLLPQEFAPTRSGTEAPAFPVGIKLSPAALANLLDAHDALLGKENKRIIRHSFAPPKHYVIKGDNLRVEAAGMRAFYDVIIPSVANEVLRKLGVPAHTVGGKVGTVAVEGTKSRDELAASVYGRGETYRNLPSEQKRKIDAMFDDRQHQQPGFLIPESLKAKVQTEGLPMFQRGLTPAEAVKRVVRVQAIVNQIKAKWKNAPKIVVISDMQDKQVPQRVRDLDAEMKSKGATGEPRGFITGGVVYIVAGQNKSVEDVITTLAHEALGHAGLRGLFGDALNKILDEIAVIKRRDVIAKAIEYGLHNAEKGATDAEVFASMTQDQKRRAAEEVLAEMAQSRPDLGFVKRAIAAIRKWLMDKGIKLVMKDSDIIAQFILPARAFIENGAKPVGLEQSLRAAFSRTSQTETEAFRNWFKGSKVVDADGKPLVVYHGTAADFTSFDAGRLGEKTGGADAKGGFFFAANPDSADQFTWANGEKSGNIMPVYLSIKNPAHGKTRLDGSNGRAAAREIEAAKAAGHDGIVFDSEMLGNVGDTWVVFDPTQIKSSIGNNGQFDPNNPDIRFSRQSAIPGTTTPQPPQLTRQPPLGLSGGISGNQASWSAPIDTAFDDFVYKYQNKHVDTKRVVQSIQAGGKMLADQWNPYLQEELYHGRAAGRVLEFVNQELEPLTKKMLMRGVTMAELDQYLLARHATEANALIASRDPGMPDGGSGMFDADAAAYFAGLDPQKRQRLDATAKEVDAMIEQTRQLYVDYGLESKDTIDGWRGMFDYYVPLKREDMDGGGTGLGQGFSIKGREAKHRTGSTSRKVVDILANIALQRESVIVRGEKNRVAASLIGMAKLNPNKDFWEVGKVPTERVLNNKTGLIETVPDHNYKNRDNVITAKVKMANGDVVEVAVVFNEKNDRAMRMAEALKNLDVVPLEGVVMPMFAMTTRWIASVNTQYNPVFGFVNLTRDVSGAVLNLNSTPLKNHKRKVLWHTLPALHGIYSDVRADRKGHQGKTNWSNLWDEFKREGGITGYRDMYRNSADRARDIQRKLDPHAWMNSGLGKVFTAGGALKVPYKVAYPAAKWLFDWLSDFNLTMENAVRLASYKVATEQGMSKQQAASLAKNLTVNFNRKGQVAQQAGAMYAFFNASVQGTARIAETITTMDRPGDIKSLRVSRIGAAIVGGGVMLGVVQAVMLALAGFDDDDPPEFVRERNLIIPLKPLTGEKNYIAIPMPLGYHVFPNIGRLITEAAIYGKPGDRTLDLMGTVVSAFNPVGGGDIVSALAPSLADPVVDLLRNKDWTGKQIYREDFGSNETPGFTRTKDTASGYAKAISEWVNDWTGGTEYSPGKLSPTPDQIDYAISQVTGGVGREFGKASQTVGAMVSGEELPSHKVPLFGRFYGSSEGTAGQAARFYANLKEANRHDAEIKGRLRDNKPEDDYLDEHPEAYWMAESGNHVEAQVRRMRGMKRKMIKDGASRDEVREIDADIAAIMREYNADVAEIKAER